MTRASSFALALVAGCVVALVPVHDSGAHMRVAAPVEVPTGDSTAWIELSHEATPHLPWSAMARTQSKRCFVVDPITLQACGGIGRRASALRVAVVPMISRSRLGLSLLGRF